MYIFYSNPLTCRDYEGRFSPPVRTLLHKPQRILQSLFRQSFFCLQRYDFSLKYAKRGR